MPASVGSLRNGRIRDVTRSNSWMSGESSNVTFQVGGKHSLYAYYIVLYRVIYIYLFRMYLFLLIHPKITAVRLEMVEIGMFLLPFFVCAMSAGFEANGTG